MFGISGGELFLIILVALIFFGSKNLPDIFKGLGKAYYEFKNATNSIKSEITNSANSIKNEVLDHSNPIAKELYEAKVALAEKEKELKTYIDQQQKEIESGAETITENTNSIPQVINSELGAVGRSSNRKNAQPSWEQLQPSQEITNTTSEEIAPDLENKEATE